ncbi:putative NBD/HSP70 family sugar kinase [Arthrobacter pascens]|uniref:ROK family protein n=1 Tax=Arthrobacter pascens TaxID=1677 RepID=UPI0027802CF1|nr:ROK family transcriptional regulator [Arthrobacter pascens]MDQ0632954.1 putative NBD/HSP70 family sugar kinase [Arthrobacter pascens]
MMEAGAATPQLLRRVNAHAVLAFLRTTDVATGTDLMAWTGLTRASVIAVCEDLLRRGWISELESFREGASQKGRPARRFELNSRAGFVLGIDIGAGTTTAAVADLRGTIVGKASRSFRGAEIPSAERIEIVDEACRAALAEAGTGPEGVLGATAGLAAPVDRDGNILMSQHFWRLFDVGLRSALKDLHGWTVLLENDANLAALGERWRGSGVGVDDLVVLLASERMGAGIIESGRLLHGHRGAAGEMAYLDMVEGVGSSAGIALLARDWFSGPRGKPRVEAREVFAAAAAGDAAAVAVLNRLSERLARIIASVAIMVNPEQVVIGGAVAESAGALLPGINTLLPRFTATVPRVTVSPLGDSIVTVGAVRHALDYVEANALDLEPAPQSPASGGPAARPER